ncbi:hypothetical protein MNEG_10154 [Monoraphidium neglectum]|uniref:Protein kinase domain-containing protein n=1 Tax=Monoraphidium neglectum TaxID=145388 RepID=A0A0D2KQC1_9CHLO|nr:hypothetical protein MNEG_10154 [Monoraphidium neglectum]KIY97808.1 hypothetical protein MNEG_10154 [Monoraphidium neglectum]|eukprot:XP_013896828.1 hypothetical protein MNEG_10154 [Monoraphidium neglectum]
MEDEYEVLCGQQPLLAVPQRSADGRFDVLRVLGGGSAAQVYEAVDMHSGEAVALKILAPDHAAPGSCGVAAGALAAAAEFDSYQALGATAHGDPGSCAADLASAAAHGIPFAYQHGVLTVSHPNTQASASPPRQPVSDPACPAPMHAAPRHDATAAAAAALGNRRYPYLSLQLLGPDLFTLMERGAFDASQAGRDRLAEVGRSMVTALEFIHDRGHVHGDLKPENIVAPRPMSPSSPLPPAGPPPATRPGAALDRQLPASFYLVDFGGMSRIDAAGARM